MNGTINSIWNGMPPVLVVPITIGLLFGCSWTNHVAQTTEDSVESRGLSQMQQPMQPGMAKKPGMPAKPSAAGQANLQLPTWPQKWDVNNREPAGFGFGVTQPGLVTVDVRAQGAPVVVSLLGAASQPVQQQSGTGPIRLTYQVSPADVQRSALWQVRIALAQPAGPPAQAAGTIAVQHPPTDVNAVRVQMQALMAQRSGPDAQAEAALKARMDAAFQIEIAKFQQEQMTRRAAMAAEVQGKLQAFQMQKKAGIRSRGLEAGESGSEPTTDPATEPATPPDQTDVTTRGGMSGMKSIQSTAGLYNPGTFKQVAPEIEWFSPLTGQPGDHVGIAVLNLGSPSPATTVTFRFTGIANPNTQQAVTYASCPSAAFTAPIIQQNEWWILVSVPEISGVIYECPFNIIVTRGSDGQTTAPMYGFTFKPAMDLRQLPMPPPSADSSVQAPDDPFNYCGFYYAVDRSKGDACVRALSPAPPGWFDRGGSWHVASATAGWFGYKGNDLFYKNKQLKNGWKVVNAEVLVQSSWCAPHAANAYVNNIGIGTNLPSLDVRVWLTSECNVRYTPAIWIRGPRGVPYE